ncbi:MAG TPA: biotin transporter BioY, partial [Ilumatobacteraceae bacterium]|nr:biotin transporter BioY [Ilumatobacteraceae bacterium]
IKVPGSPVPVTGQTLGVGLVGASLGARRGGASLLGYVLAGLALPVYADGSKGWGVLWGATGGYLIGMVFAAALIGALAERAADRKVLTAFAAFIGAQLLIFGFGLAGLKIYFPNNSWSWVIDVGFAPFIVGGLIKAAIGGMALPAAWHAVKRLDRVR